MCKTEQLQVYFEKLKSEFQLLKLCRRNQINTNVKKKNQETSLNDLKYSICNLIFKTGTGLKVYTDLEQRTQVNEAELKFKHCVITCSVLNVMKKDILCEHNFKYTQCTEAFKEECRLKTHTTNAH